MSSITAAQLIYGTVEAELSPTGRAGHQVLMKTRNDIGDQEAAEIEARLFYPARSSPAVKHLFFPAGGKHVVARIAPLSERDAFGRGGSFLAHALIVDFGALAAIENNPFSVFCSFAFCTNPQEALDRRDGAAGEIGPVQIEVHSASAKEEQGRGAEWFSLMLAALRAPQMMERHEGLGLAGSPENAFALLESLFPLIPIQARPYCSFDTCFAGGNLIRTPYWAAGAPTTEFRSPEWVVFDLNERRFRRSFEIAPSNTFERWLYREWDSGRPLGKVTRRAEEQFAAAAWLDGAPANAISAHDDLRQFLSSERSALERRLVTILAARTCCRLAERLSARAADWLLAVDTPLAEHLRNDLRDAPIERWLFDMVSGSERPAVADLEALNDWMSPQSQPSPVLRMRMRRWMGQWAELAADIVLLTDQQYRDFAAWALTTVDLRARPSLYLDGRTAALGLCAEIAIDDTSIRGLLSALAGTMDNGSSSSGEESIFNRVLRSRSRSREEAEWTTCRISASRMQTLMGLLIERSAEHER